ncbi:UNVERIFIED_CONTAM: Contactin-5 [Gekko kuhli]
MGGYSSPQSLSPFPGPVRSLAGSCGTPPVLPCVRIVGRDFYRYDREVGLLAAVWGSPSSVLDRAVFRITVLPDGTLRILNATKLDEGRYVCRGENIFGSAEITASVFIKVPTRIDLSPKRTELTVGESIVLSCKALHDPTLDVIFHWTLNGQPIDFEKEGGHFESILVVSMVQHLYSPTI